MSCATRGSPGLPCGAGRSASCTRAWTASFARQDPSAREVPIARGDGRRVLELTLSEPPGEAPHWTGRVMAQVSGMSLRLVQRIWAAHGLEPHRIRTFKLSRDPQRPERLKDVVGLSVDPPAHAVVLSVDEKSQVQAHERTQP